MCVIVPLSHTQSTFNRLDNKSHHSSVLNLMDASTQNKNWSPFNGLKAYYTSASGFCPCQLFLSYSTEPHKPFSISLNKHGKLPGFDLCGPLCCYLHFHPRFLKLIFTTSSSATSFLKMTASFLSLLILLSLMLFPPHIGHHQMGFRMSGTLVCSLTYSFGI